jgi:glycosyltransferase involved in cell wall biosynthesis
MSGDINEKKIKILYLITISEFGGAQKYVLDMAKNLKDEHDVMVAYGEAGSNSLLMDKLTEAGIRHQELKNLKRDIRIIKDIKALFEITKLINKFRPNIVHLNSSKISILGTLAGMICRLGWKNRRLKIVYTVHGWVFNEPMAYLKKIFYIYAEKLSSYAKDQVICIDNFDLRLAKNTLKIKSSKLTVIYLGLDIEKINLYEKPEAQEILLNKFPICSPEFKPKIFIGAIGHLYKTKGYEYMIAAMEIVCRKQKNFALFIIGEGDERLRLEKLIRKFRLENNVFLSGSLDQAANLLMAFNIYVCSSVKEGLPYTILEAMYAGLPIVTTDVGGIPDMIHHNKNGLLVESKNPDQLAERILKLLNDDNLKLKLGANAHKIVLDKFKLERMIDDTKYIYKDLLA